MTYSSFLHYSNNKDHIYILSETLTEGCQLWQISQSYIWCVFTSFCACSCHGVTNSQQKLYLKNLDLNYVKYPCREFSFEKIINHSTFSVIVFLNHLMIQSFMDIENLAVLCRHGYSHHSSGIILLWCLSGHGKVSGDDSPMCTGEICSSLLRLWSFENSSQPRIST